MKGELAIKVVIKQRILRGSGEGGLLQHVATVYVDGDEYRVLAPPDAVGDALNWIDHFHVHRSSSETPGADVEVDGAFGILAIKCVQEELENTQRGPDAGADVRPIEPYYHVRVFATKEPRVEVKFDLRLVELERRILEPYRAVHPIVIGGRTITVEDLERIEIFRSPRPSSQFGEWTETLARQGVLDWFYGEPGVKNVTDEFITTPAAAVLPRGIDAIELLCLRFDVVARQLRHRREGRRTLDVNDEYDVQDLIHALLRIFFDDVRPEEWTPSYGGKSSRMDFLLPVEQSVIEVKKTRDGLDAKGIGSQLIEDIARYKKHPSCKRLICFVYDPEHRIANPRGIERDLGRSEVGFEVQVIIAPRG